ncbi:hypothetical protein BGZ88_010294 [Linnemannia elongata]|nr:hypothetical protein BGZ88_010294 [Linnemannia elongata]
MSEYSRSYLKGVAGDYASTPQHYNDPRQTMPQTPPSSNSTPYTSSSNITLRSMQEEVMINNHTQELTMPPGTGTGTEAGTGTGGRLSEPIMLHLLPHHWDRHHRLLPVNLQGHHHQASGRNIGGPVVLGPHPGRAGRAVALIVPRGPVRLLQMVEESIAKKRRQ